MIKKANQKVQLDNIKKSRLLYHKYLQKQSFSDMIQPSKTHFNSKIITLSFLSALIFILFLFRLPKDDEQDTGNTNLMSLFKKRDDSIEENKEDSTKIFKPKATRLDKFSQNMFFLIILISIIYIVSFTKFVEHPEANFFLDSTQNLLSQFTIIYILVNTISIISAQGSIKTWFEYENQVKERVQICRKFEKLYIKDKSLRDYEKGREEMIRKQRENEANNPDRQIRRQAELDDEEIPEGLTAKEKEEYSSIKKIVKFIVLRQEFLSPTFLPAMKECFLRDDFRFCDYLGKCYYKTINEVLDLRFSTILTFLIFLLSYYLLRATIPESYEIYAVLSLSIVFFGLQILLKYKAERVFANLSYPLTSPYEFQVAPFDAVRNPKMNEDKIFIPFYLRDNFRDVRVTKKRLINSHQSLFWFSSAEFCKRTLHFFLIYQISMMIIFYNNYYQDILSSKFNFFIGFVVAGLFAVNLGLTLPVTIRHFSIITNVRLMIKLQD